MTPSRDISRLLEIMAALRTPVTGCPWDLEQNFATIAPYTIEEAYEVADAITRGDFDDLREELGDLLLQVVYHARMAEEQNAFAFGDVVEAITRKMIRRHPHVFADKDGNIAAAGVKSAWERIKAEEKAERAARRPPEETTHKSLLATVKAGQPALTRAMELQRKASTVGFDWNDPARGAQQDPRRGRRDRSRARSSAMPTNSLKKPAISCSRWSIWRGMSAPIPKAALRGTNAKFERRFAYIERRCRRRDAHSRTQRSTRWTRCGTRRRARSSLHRRPGQRSASRDPYRGISRLGTRLIPCAKSLPVAMGPC